MLLRSGTFISLHCLATLTIIKRLKIESWGNWRFAHNCRKRLSFSRRMLSRRHLREVFFLAAPQYIRVFNKQINRPNMLKLKYATRALMGVRLFR